MQCHGRWCRALLEWYVGGGSAVGTSFRTVLRERADGLTSDEQWWASDCALGVRGGSW